MHEKFMLIQKKITLMLEKYGDGEKYGGLGASDILELVEPLLAEQKLVLLPYIEPAKRATGEKVICAGYSVFDKVTGDYETATCNVPLYAPQDLEIAIKSAQKWILRGLFIGCGQSDEKVITPEIVSENNAAESGCTQEKPEKVIKAYEKFAGHTATEVEIDDVSGLVDRWGLDAVLYGFSIATRNKVNKLNYVESCARNYAARASRPKNDVEGTFNALMAKHGGERKNDVEGTVEEAIRILNSQEDNDFWG